jgi:hypothetical protein
MAFGSLMGKGVFRRYKRAMEGERVMGTGEVTRAKEEVIAIGEMTGKEERAMAIGSLMGKGEGRREKRAMEGGRVIGTGEATQAKEEVMAIGEMTGKEGRAMAIGSPMGNGKRWTENGGVLIRIEFLLAGKNSRTNHLAGNAGM